MLFFIEKIVFVLLLSLFSMNSFASSSQFIDLLDGQLDASQYLSENA